MFVIIFFYIDFHLCVNIFRYYGLIAIRKTVCAETVIVKFVDCEWPMYAFPLILVVTHYILWFESLLILNNPVSNINMYLYFPTIYTYKGNLGI